MYVNLVAFGTQSRARAKTHQGANNTAVKAEDRRRRTQQHTGKQNFQPNTPPNLRRLCGQKQLYAAFFGRLL